MSGELASVEDVAVRLMRPLSPEESAAALAMIGDASVMIRARYPDAGAIYGADLALLLAGAVARAVARVLANPGGRISEAIDDYSYRRADSVADGRLYISGEDWAAIALLLRPEAITATSAFTISPYVGLR